jgi:hypothetical protein
MWAGVNGLSQTMTSACTGSGRHTGIPSSRDSGPEIGRATILAARPPPAGASPAFARKRRRSAMRLSGI